MGSLLLVSAVVVGQSFGIPAVYRPRSDWNAIVKHIVENSQEGDGVLIWPNYHLVPYTYVVKRHYQNAPSVVTYKKGEKVLMWNDRWYRMDEKTLSRIARKYNRIWLVSAPEKNAHPGHTLKKGVRAFQPHYPITQHRTTITKIHLINVSKSPP